MSKSIWKRIAIVIATVAATFGLALVTVAPISGAAASEAGACEDPDGDGWGWNGVESCIAPTTPHSTSGSYGGGPGGDRYKNYRVICEDSGHGDWGWAELHVIGTKNGARNRYGTSCKVGNEVSFKIRQSGARLIEINGAFD